MDCMRLFTKEDVLDGDEKPVPSPCGSEGASPGALFGVQQPRNCCIWLLASHMSPSQLCPVISFRRAVTAEPENGV